MDQPSDDPLRFDCPRCGAMTADRFYGPCPSCRDTLRSTLGGHARDVSAAPYEPKMNVTPDNVSGQD